MEQAVVRVFLDRLRTLDDDRRQLLADAVRADDEPVAVQTVFELRDENKHRLSETLRAATGAETGVEFDLDADLGLGIELRAGGHKVAWSLQSYFADMEERIRERIDAELARGSASPAAREERKAVTSAQAPATNPD
jgi:hypothetical protein